MGGLCEVWDDWRSRPHFLDKKMALSQMVGGIAHVGLPQLLEVLDLTANPALGRQSLDARRPKNRHAGHPGERFANLSRLVERSAVAQDMMSRRTDDRPRRSP